MPWALELCADAGVTLAGLDGIAVARGPGAFTGVRVGLATATGLGLGLGVPVVALSSLDSRAARVDERGPVLALLDARKGRAYAALYEAGVLRRGPEDVEPAVAVRWAAAPFAATGEGAVVFESLVRSVGGRVAPGAEDPAVDVLARLGAAALERGEGTDALAVEPLYVRPPDAKKPNMEGR